MTLVISGFPGVGKSSLFKTAGDTFKMTDSDSSKFPKDEFPENYIAYIKGLCYVNELDIAFVSSHKPVRDSLVANNIPFILVYPKKDLLSVYLDRYEKRGSPESFIELLKNNWDTWITECEEFEGVKYELQTPDDNIGNNINKIILAYKAGYVENN